MRLAVDGRTLQSRPLGGVGRALRGVLGHLPGAARDAGIELTGVDLLTDARLPDPQTCSLPGDIEVHALRTLAPLRGPAWLQLSVPRWLASAGRARDVRLFHCPFYGLPYRQPVASVVSMYDVTFLDHGEWFRPSTRAALRIQARHAARTARTVITGSCAAASQVTQLLAVHPDRVLVAPPAVDQVFLDAGRTRGPRTASAAWRRGYVVAMGGAARRNLPLAVEAWQGARHAGAEIDLVVVGPLNATERRAAQAADGLHLAGAVGDDELARLLSGALAFVYPTAYEGFGLPAAEAAATGTPVVCTPVGALPDLLGDAAEWCHPVPGSPPVEAVTAAVLRLAHESDRAARIGEAAHLRMAAAPGHDNAARLWAAAYARALAG